MPPNPLFDLSKIDLAAVAYDKEAICRVKPQSLELQQLDCVVWYDKKVDSWIDPVLESLVGISR